MNDNLKKWADLLNGRQYGSEITCEEEATAKADGVVIVFGYSDDNVELRGALSDEYGCYEGGKLTLDREGVIPKERDENWDDASMLNYLQRKQSKTAKTLTCTWDKEGYSWTYAIDVPFETFEIFEDDTKYCRGIVFELNSL